ncbi:hypothetical protein WJX72_007072 [[Myrmecia] bisecta]|uniref:RIB43A-like with coiled-coils protein 1 n=1 Tax=[Myrmecia] bisecta TaxID=41462 RepID=A0AAW1Q6H8_9CHLO
MGKLVAQVPNEDPARLQRIQDAKYRTIGVDAKALAQQVQEKKARELAEAQRDREYARLAQYFDSAVCQNKAEADQKQASINREVQAFQKGAQGVHTTREWDLNRPDALRLDAPARLNDEDARCGPASLQRFSGEDLTVGERVKAQHEQCRDWWTQQAQEKQALAQANKQQRENEADWIKYQDTYQAALAQEERKIKADYNRDTLTANQDLAAQRRARALAERNAELNASNGELAAAIESPWLAEDPNTAASALSPYRVRKDHWKGMSEAEKRAIAAEQLAQMEDRAARRQAELQAELLYARTQANVARAIDVHALQVEDFKADQARKAAAFLKAQMAEKQQRDAELKGLYTNPPKPEYFAQFGTSHR